MSGTTAVRTTVILVRLIKTSTQIIVRHKIPFIKSKS